MAIGHMHGHERPYQPSKSAKVGGSKKGKAHARWPLILKVIADAIVMQAKGTIDACVTDRRRILTKARCEQLMDRVAPGWRAWREHTSDAETDPFELLDNRRFTQTWNRKVKRGPARASVSSEHWRAQVKPGYPFSLYPGIHDEIMTGEIESVPNWMDLAMAERAKPKLRWLAAYRALTGRDWKAAPLLEGLSS